MELGAAQHRGEELWNHVQVVVGWEEDFSSVHPSRGPYCSSRREERCCAHPPRNGRVVGPGLSRAQNHSWTGWWSPTGKKEPPSTSRGFACRSQGCPILLCCHLPHPTTLPAPPAPSHHPASPGPARLLPPPWALTVQDGCIQGSPSTCMGSSLDVLRGTKERRG